MKFSALLMIGLTDEQCCVEQRNGYISTLHVHHKIWWSAKDRKLHCTYTEQLLTISRCYYAQRRNTWYSNHTKYTYTVHVIMSCKSADHLSASNQVTIATVSRLLINTKISSLETSRLKWIVCRQLMGNLWGCLLEVTEFTFLFLNNTSSFIAIHVCTNVPAFL